MRILALIALLLAPTFALAQANLAPAPPIRAPVNDNQATNKAYVDGLVAARAPLASPTFTGTPTAPCTAANDNSTRLACTAYVDSAIAALPEIYAVRYGVVANTGTDQGPALRAALTVAQAKKATLVTPAGIILVGPDAGDTDALLRISTLAGIRGSGGRSTTLVPTGSVGTRATILIKPLASGGGIRGAAIRDISLGFLGGTKLGCDGIRIDTTNTSGFVGKLTIENVGIAASALGAGCYSINHVNDPTANPTGGLFGSTIRDNDLFAGTKFYRTGDSNNIERNIITGPGAGIEYEAISGAATHRITGNNITASGGAIIVRNSGQVYIEQNQTEQSFAYTGTENAGIVIDNVGAWTLRSNNMNGYTRVDNVLLKNGARSGKIDGNTMVADVAGGKFHVTATGSPMNTIGINQYLNASYATVGRALSLDAASLPTRNVFQPLTLQNSWVAATNTSFIQGLYAMVDEQDVLHLEGGISGGTLTAGATAATLPAAMRPVGKARYIAAKVVGTPWTLGMFQILPSGEVQILSVGSNSLVHFDDVSFSAR